jgi:hypothetical protein
MYRSLAGSSLANMAANLILELCKQLLNGSGGLDQR